MNDSAPRAPYDVCVVVCTYTEDRWDDLVRAVESLRSQIGVNAEVVVVVDHNAELLGRVLVELPWVNAVKNGEEKGLSGARNSGIAASRAPIVAFLDDDADAEPTWLQRIVAGYRDNGVMAVGGRVEPRWDAGRPRYFPPEFDWVVGCSYVGMPESRAPVRNLIGANMSFRRDVFDTVGGFVSGIGRVDAIPLGCEETELCIRARRQFPSQEVVYDPSAVVHHRVFPARGSLKYFFARCAAEGRSKAAVSRLTGTDQALETERSYVAKVLPAGIRRDLRAATRGDLAGFSRAALIVSGAAVTAVSYALARSRTGRGGGGRRA